MDKKSPPILLQDVPPELVDQFARADALWKEAAAQRQAAIDQLLEFISLGESSSWIGGFVRRVVGACGLTEDKLVNMSFVAAGLDCDVAISRPTSVHEFIDDDRLVKNVLLAQLGSRFAELAKFAVADVRPYVPDDELARVLKPVWYHARRLTVKPRFNPNRRTEHVS